MEGEIVMELLKVEELTFTYPRQEKDAGEVLPALSGVSFRYRKGNLLWFAENPAAARLPF